MFALAIMGSRSHKIDDKANKNNLKKEIKSFITDHNLL